MRRPSAAYTGEPDMPAQIPPTRSISAEVSRARIMSRPGAMPSLTTPSTSPVNGSGVVPWLTVRPVTGCPAASDPTGTAEGQSGSSADTAVVEPVTMVAVSYTHLT